MVTTKKSHKLSHRKRRMMHKRKRKKKMIKKKRKNNRKRRNKTRKRRKRKRKLNRIQLPDLSHSFAHYLLKLVIHCYLHISLLWFKLNFIAIVKASVELIEYF